ncbi:MBL fold metallo-hydrolase [Risungbinella massiliensis]|uniref:MBL fold metallo-hydrolase n=1 Tax=Risungbinella massiliensis TaxID=1329796 RepID=UPI0005CBC4D7|nr:MBL fold metallo-hydrolase [Risungbinella massiliensis]
MWILLLVVLLLAGAVYAHFQQMPKASLRQPAQYLQPSEWSSSQVTIGWIGHSSLLINLYGKWILTDPVFGKRVGVDIFHLQFGIKRHVLPAIDLEEMPPIDYILLSHAHMDHLDIPTLKKLANPNTTVVTAKNTSKLFRNMPFQKIVELEGKDAIMFDDDVRVQAVPVRHWGNRFPWNVQFGYSGYVLESKGSRIFFPGDTAYTPNFRWLRDLKLDITCMPIGAYSPDSFQRAHCTPEQAWEMYQDTGAKYLIPIHWNTFVLSREPILEPIKRLQQAAGNNVDQIVLTKHGESFSLKHNVESKREHLSESEITS